MARPAAWELKRQIAFTETMKKNSIEKHETKLDNFDGKLEALREQLAEATVESK